MAENFQSATVNFLITADNETEVIRRELEYALNQASFDLCSRLKYSNISYRTDYSKGEEWDR